MWKDKCVELGIVRDQDITRLWLPERKLVMGMGKDKAAG
jgi:hypothetical protein